MKDNIKNALGVVGVLGILVLGYAVVVYAQAYASSIEPASYRSFSVTGDGRAVAVPDVAQITFTVITEGDTDVAKLQTDNTNKVNAAIAFVKGQGVDAKDVQTASYAVSPRYQTYKCDTTPVAYPANGSAPAIAPAPCPPSEIVGYTITQSVTVKVRDFTKVGAILSGVVQNGANRVSGPNFVIDDPYQVQNEARKQAIERAEERAKEIAVAGGFTLGRLLSIDDSGYPVYYGKALGMGASDVAMSAPAAAPAPAIEPGSQDVNVTVTLRYEIR